MEGDSNLADLLKKYVARSAYKPAQLAQLSGIPKPTIVNWLTGRVRKPRAWQDIVKLAGVLHLIESETTELLVAVGHPPIDELLAFFDEEPHRTLLAPWTDAFKQKHAKAPFQSIPGLPYFVGREEELQTLQDALLNGRPNKFCSLQGMAGVGKTTLAAHLTYELRKFFPDGILWARVDTTNPLAILSTFASAYGRDINQYPELEDRSRAVRDLLADKRALIVLDNVQTSAQVKPLLPPTTGACAVLLTTRRQDLSVTYSMQRFSLGPFNREKQESLTFFQKTLGTERIQNGSNNLVEIAELLGHLPLAIAIIANRLAYEPGWQITDILDRLRCQEQRIGELVNENQNVKLSFNLSYTALTSDQQKLFAALSTIGGEDFNVATVAYIINRSEKDVHDQLRKLYGLSMIQLGQACRYRLHPLLRTYALEQINDDNLWKEMVEYFVGFAIKHEREYDLLDLEFSNIQTALQVAFERGMYTVFIQGINALYLFLEGRGLHEAIEKYLDQAEQAARSTQNAKGLALTLFHKGRLVQQLGNYEQAQSYLEEGLTLAKESNQLKAIGYRFLGWSLWQAGKYENARLHLEQALTLAKTIPLPQIEADSLNNLGITHWYLGNNAKARTYYEQAVFIYRQINDRRNESDVLLNLGKVSLKQGDSDKGYHFLKQGLQICREIGYLQGEGRALNTLGVLFYYQGVHIQSQAYYEQALDIWQKLSYLRGERIVLRNLGLVLFEQGYYTEAKDYYEQALNIKPENNNNEGKEMELYHLANVYHCLGDYEMGRTLYRQVLHVFRNIHYYEGEGDVLADLGLLFHHLGDDESACEYGQQALSIGKKIGADHIRSSALTLLGHALVNLVRPTEADTVYRQALALRHKLGQRHLAIEIVAGLARLLFSQDKLHNALAHIEEIMSYIETGSLDGTKEPFRVYLTCYQVLAAHNDPRAEIVLDTAHNLLQERASSIEDKPLRRAFLDNVYVHKEIIDLYTTQIAKLKMDIDQ